MVCHQLRRIVFFVAATLLILIKLSPDVSCQPNPIINVKSFCASDLSGQTRVLVVSDIPEFSVVATCAGGFKYNFTAVDAASKEIHIPFTGNASLQCVFRKKVSSATYTAEVNVGLTSSGPLLTDQFYLITCTYDPFIQGQSSVNRFYDSMYPRLGVYKHMGSNSTSEFKLSVVNILNRPIHGAISALQYLKLKIELTAPSAGVVSFQVISCEATNGINVYALLFAGCGDGKLILDHRGFHTLGKFAYSDAFRSFLMFGGDAIYFTCRLIMCTQNCDGPSCVQQTNKRSALDGREEREVQNTDRVVAVIDHLDSVVSAGYYVIHVHGRRSARDDGKDVSDLVTEYEHDTSLNTNIDVNVRPIKPHMQNSPIKDDVYETKIEKPDYFTPKDEMPLSDDAINPFPVTVYAAIVLALLVAGIAIAWYTVRMRNRSGMKIRRSLITRPYSIKF